MKQKIFLLVIISCTLGSLGSFLGLSAKQSIILAIFSMSILGTLFFWDFRLSFVFIGTGILVSIGAVNMDQFIKFASLDVILFLISMMIIVGMMKDAGFFEWLITLLLRVKNLTGTKAFIIIMLTSAVFSGLMDEVTSIIVMTAVILNISDFLEIDPLQLQVV